VEALTPQGYLDVGDCVAQRVGDLLLYLGDGRFGGSPFGRQAADDARKLVLATSSCLAAVSAVLAAQAFAGLGVVWLLYLLVTAQSALGAVDRPARSTFSRHLSPGCGLARARSARRDTRPFAGCADAPAGTAGSRLGRLRDHRRAWPSLWKGGGSVCSRLQPSHCGSRTHWQQEPVSGA